MTLSYVSTSPKRSASKTTPSSHEKLTPQPHPRLLSHRSLSSGSQKLTDKLIKSSDYKTLWITRGGGGGGAEGEREDGEIEKRGKTPHISSGHILIQEQIRKRPNTNSHYHINTFLMSRDYTTGLMLCLHTQRGFHSSKYLFLVMKFISFYLLDLFPYSVGDKVYHPYLSMTPFPKI